MKIMRKLLGTKCCECGEVHIWFWQRRCSFCDPGEGKLK